jgi:hypothetical protein
MSANETAEAILIVIKRLAKWLLYGVLIIAFLIGVFIAFLEIQSHLKGQPKFVSSLKDLELDEKFSDVLFKTPGLALLKEPSIREWGEAYRDKDRSVDVWVKSGRVSAIGYYCKTESEYTSVNGVLCAASGDSILEKYGKHLRVQCLLNKSDPESASLRVYDVPKFGIRHYLVSNKVVVFVAMSTKQLEEATGKAWGPCD